MMKMARVSALAGVFAAWFAATAAEPGPAFTRKPTAVRDAGKVRIEFAVSGRTDVEVAVLADDGKVVRRLAAGVLGGKNPPPPPLAPGLSQAVEWDGKDDAGKPAAGAPFKVRVRLGTGVKFGRILGANPTTGTLGGDALALDADGTIFVKMGSFVPQLHQALPWQLRKFDKTGRYVTTLLPYAPSTDPAKTPGFQLADAGDGLLTPRHMTPLDVVLFHFGDVIHNRVVDGSVVFVDNGAARLTFFKVDGSNEVRVVPMRTAPGKLEWAKWLAPQVAFSPDGKFAYYSNVAKTPYDGKKPSDIDPKFPQGRVYRHDLTKAGSDPEPFYDLVLPDWEKTKYWMPSAWDKKSAAAGVDTDAKGNLFVCDLVNQEVVEVSPEGKKVSAAKVPWPDKVVASRKSDTLYVISCAVSRGFRPPSTLLKVTGRGDEAKVVAKLPLTGDLGQSIALDESGEMPSLLVGGSGSLVRVEDRGAELAFVGSSIVNTDKNAIGFVCYGDVDAEGELVYITEGMGSVWRYHGETGEGGLAPIRACDLAIGPGGLIYAWGDTGKYAGPVTRYSRDWKPAPLAATGKHTYGYLACRYGRGNSVAGLDVDPRGWVYATNGGNSCHVQVYDADGNPVKFEREATIEETKGAPVPALITGMTDQSGSIRVDRDGNVYVVQLGLPKGHVPPKGFEKDPAYLACTGMVYKFGPKGGEFIRGKAGLHAVGALRIYDAGCGPISGAWASTISVCHCMKPRFDIDPYGRLYIPHGVTFKVYVRDNADNEVLTFGGYGNFDAQGPESREPKPEIPLGWPIFAGASDKYIYIGDGLNHRVVRVDRVFAAEETCPVK